MENKSGCFIADNTYKKITGNSARCRIRTQISNLFYNKYVCYNINQRWKANDINQMM